MALRGYSACTARDGQLVRGPQLFHELDTGSTPGVALTFEKLRIANAQHGKNCVSSPAAKATISTDWLEIDKHENTTNFVQLHFNLRHAWRVCVISVYGCHEHRNVGTSIPPPGCDGERRGRGTHGRCSTNLLCWVQKTKRLNAFWYVRSLFFVYSKRTAFSDLRSLLFFCVKNAVFSRKCDPWTHFYCPLDSARLTAEKADLPT